MTLSDIGIVFGICIPLVGGAGAGGKYWLEHEFVPIGSVEQAFNKRDQRDIKRMIRKLEYLESNNQITEAQRWELNGLREELEELEDAEENN